MARPHAVLRTAAKHGVRFQQEFNVYSIRGFLVSAALLCGLFLAGQPWLAAGGKAKKAAEPNATPVSLIKAKKDFKVELLYSVPAKTQGSWVSMCVDPKGRLFVSDQYGKLF